MLYIRLFHQDTGYHVNGRHVLGHWSDLPTDLQILFPVTVIAHLIFLVSFARMLLLRKALGSRDELGE